MKTTTLCEYALIFGISLQLCTSNLEAQPEQKIVYRAAHSLEQLKLSPKGDELAFIETYNKKLMVLDMETKKLKTLSHFPHPNGRFFWSPYGYRLFFQELNPAGHLIKSYNLKDKAIVVQAEPSDRTSFISFDPIRMALAYVQDKVLKIHQLAFYDNRIARWQKALRKTNGFFIVAPKAVFWIHQNQVQLKRLTQKNRKIGSFSVSPDGTMIAWSDDLNRLYLSENGSKPKLIDKGTDPNFHSQKPLLLYAGARSVGDAIFDWDIKVLDLKGKKRWLTQTPHSAERWPQFDDQRHQIIFTKERTTDLFSIASPL